MPNILALRRETFAKSETSNRNRSSMKICFIQKQAFAYFGIMSLSGYLKKFGFQTDVLIANLENDLISKVKQIDPDVIGISALTPEHSWLINISKLIKQELPELPIIVGGVHAILYPQKILDIPYVDFVCLGEGEKALHGLLSGKNPSGIKGIAYKTGESYRHNEQETLLGNLSSHFDDRNIYYDRYSSLKADHLKQFYSSRGCPFKCSFCFNKQLSAVFKGHGRYLRSKEPQHFISEIESVMKNSPTRSVYFADDLFTLNTKWLSEFLPLYSKKVGLPFMCVTRANLMTEEIAAMLKKAGCHTISFGVETGNEHIRKTVLKKNVTDKQLLDCASVLKKHGIRIQTSNMFALPHETLDDALDTIELNIKMKTDFLFSTLLMPFPETELSDYCIENGFLTQDFNFEDLPESFLTTSVLSIPEKEKIENVQKIAHLLVRFPIIYRPMRFIIKRFNFRKPFYWLLFLNTFIRYKEERKISLINAIRFLWRFRKSY